MLLREVLPRLLEGNTALAVLWEQLREVTVAGVELSGVGFLAHLTVPLGLPTADPARIVGSDAEIVLSGEEHGAGCPVFVDDGRLSLFEGYTYGGKEWTEATEVVSIGRMTPEAPASQEVAYGRMCRSRRSLQRPPLNASIVGRQKRDGNV